MADQENKKGLAPIVDFEIVNDRSGGNFDRVDTRADRTKTLPNGEEYKPKMK